MPFPASNARAPEAMPQQNVNRIAMQLFQFRFIELLRGAIPSPGGKVARLSAAKEKGSEEERRHLKYRKKYEQR